MLPSFLGRISAVVGMLAAVAGFVAPTEAPAQGSGASSLRFYGFGAGDVDRVKIRIDDPGDAKPGPPADVGATDVTIEWWLRAEPASNPTDVVTCGANINWIYGNIVLDRDRYNQGRKFGISLAGGRVVFGVSGDGTGDVTICGTTDLRDGEWHHVAVQRRRSDGRLELFVDGSRQANADGPDGDISYPDDGVPGDYCAGPCTNSDPFLVLGAEKHDAGPEYPAFNGWIDELRLSTTLRYAGDFRPPQKPFTPDPDTAALYHLDEGAGDLIGDAMGASPGERRYGGSPTPGPAWSSESPFGAGAPGPRCDGRVATIVGTAEDDVLEGTAGRDVVVARGGNDTVWGYGGGDIICGGPGRDVLLGGRGRDNLLGGRGTDRCRGEFERSCERN